MTTSKPVLDAVAKHRRYGRVEILIVACFVIVLALGSLFALVALDRQHNIVVTNADIKCLLGLDAKYARAEANALAFAPGTPERLAASTEMKAIADEFAAGCDR